MTLIESSKLLEERVAKAIALINLLRREKQELTERLAMVVNHNDELQELLNKSSADTAEIEAAITSALGALDTLDLEDLGDFGTLDASELEAAENFGLDGSSDVELETFENTDI